MRNRKMKTRICADCGEGATVMVHSKGTRCNSCAKKRDHDKGVDFNHGHKWTDEQKAAMSEILQGREGRKWTEEQKKAMSEALMGRKGRTWTEEQRKAMSEAFMGREGYTKTHGMSRTAIYRVWAGMLQRCHNPNSISYARYGKKGIYVYPAWLQFERFLKDMGERKPTDHLHRLDAAGPYSPDNCVWLDATEHMRLHGLEQKDRAYLT